MERLSKKIFYSDLRTKHLKMVEFYLGEYYLTKDEKALDKARFFSDQSRIAKEILQTLDKQFNKTIL